MRIEFGSVDSDQWRIILISEKWDELPRTSFSAHLSECSDCVQSLLQFLQTNPSIDYAIHPCFHVAYYSADSQDRCLDLSLGMYFIVTDRETRAGIVIGFCPWCGVALPIGLGPKITVPQP